MDIKDYIRLAVCSTILFTLLAYPSPVSACSCEGGLTIANQIAQHDAIFTGRVVRIVDNYYPIFSNLDNIFRKFSLPSYFINEDGRYWGYSVFLDVFTSWKGVEKTIVEVDTGSGGSDCGYTFEMDKDYLVYASHAYGLPGNYWVTGTCGRNTELSSASEDLEFLGRIPIIPLKSTLPIMFTEKDLIYASPFVVVGIVVFARQWRRRKK